MEYWQTLLDVLGGDLQELGGAVIAFALALAFPSYWLSFLARALIDGTPREIIWKGTLWGWFAGIVSFVFTQFALQTVGFLTGRYLGGFDWYSLAFCFLLGCFVSFLLSAIYFQHCRRMNGVEVPQRWAYSLRTFVVAQVMLALLMGWWITTRRGRIDSHIRFRHQLAEMKRQEQYKAECKAKFSRYGWTVYMYSAHADGPQDLILMETHFRQPLAGFNDHVLEQITAEEHITTLHITSDKLTDEGLKTIGSFTTLENLKIASSQITDSGLIHLRNLHNLRELEIFSDQMTDAGVAHFKDVRRLERVSVQSVELTEASFAHLAAIESLKYGMIYDSQITKEQQAEFLEGRQGANSEIYAFPRRPISPRPASVSSKNGESKPSQP